MNNQELHDLLVKVHDEIEQTDAIDEKSRELLRDLDEHIRNLIEGEPHAAGVAEQLEFAIQHFEVTHPVFSKLLTRLMEILSGAGI